MRKYRFLISLLILMMLFTSCAWKEIPYSEVHAEFEQYEQKNDFSVLVSDYMYFHDREIAFAKIFPDKTYGKDYYVQQTGIVNGEIYYLILIRGENTYSSFALYQSDVNFEELTLVFEHPHSTDRISASMDMNWVYFDALEGDVRKVFCYDIISGQLQLLTEGDRKSFVLNDIVRERVHRDYSVEAKGDSFIVTEKSTGEQRVIDDAFLKTTEFSSSLKKFGYDVQYYSLVNNHVILMYRLKTTRGIFPLEEYYTMAAFEYNFQENQLSFLATFHPINGGMQSQAYNFISS